MRYKHSICFFSLLFLMWAMYCLFPRPGNCQNLTLNNQLSFLKDTATFKVSIRNAPNAVQSFGFDLHFDSQILKYLGYKKGKMMEEYDFMDCVQIRPGVLRCGGFDKGKNSIMAGQTELLLTVQFQKINCNHTVLSFKGLTDDLEGWHTGTGRFFCFRK